METIRCLCATLLLLVACQKEQEQIPKLVSFTDPGNKYSVVYNGNSVSEIQVDSGVGAPYTIASYSYTNNFIVADLHPNTGYSKIEYQMKNHFFPLSIKKYKSFAGKDSAVSRVQFYYRAGDVLDSITLDGTTHYRFVPLYAGGNVTDYYISTENGPEILSGSFLYYPITNVFKTTNPLLFIYSNPVFQFETFLLPRLFSNSTMKKFNGGSFTYNTDARGKLSLEDYGNTYPYKRTYLYK